MKTNDILKVALRNNAIFVGKENLEKENQETNATTFALVSNIAKLGFGFSEELLIAMNKINPNDKVEIFDIFQEVLGTNYNWTPLVKNWEIPTGENKNDHIVTLLANIFQSKQGTVLQCGHVIPEHTFPLERYNGCPFCGTPFESGKIENLGQGSKLKVLELWTNKDVENYFRTLLESKTALDATQIDSLKLLVKNLEIPIVSVSMKETVMILMEELIKNERSAEAQKFLKTPTDILRFLWYKKTGYLQIIEPKTIIKRSSKNNEHITTFLDKSYEAKISAKENLKLKYSRKECLMVANWLNNLEQNSEKICEMMHPKRGMWVRFIRALRLAEYSKRNGFEKLAEILDKFYNQDYEVWESRVNHFRLKVDAEKTFTLLKERPGLFARSLFSNMLWFGEDIALKHFEEIVDKIPARLVLTLNMYAKIYFDKNTRRTVKPLGGNSKNIGNHPVVKLYEESQLNQMKEKIEDLCVLAMKKRFEKVENHNKTIFIEPNLYNIPLNIGDRSDNIQDLPSVLMGTKFPLEGKQIRLFMQWGKDLPAQHLDMDLSCQIAYENKTEVCSYYQLVSTGCKHSGDIRSIPNKIGTAEYINIDCDELKFAGAKYVTFTCNAYSNGNISPNLVLGWMDSKNPMKVSETTGVAYDPSCVIHQIKIKKGLSKGLVFGVLDVQSNEIIWLEMNFGGQNIQSLDFKGVKSLLEKLNSKLSIGNLLQLKAEAQNLKIVENNENADEIYDMNWAINSANVSELFLD